MTLMSTLSPTARKAMWQLMLELRKEPQAKWNLAMFHVPAAATEELVEAFLVHQVAPDSWALSEYGLTWVVEHGDLQREELEFAHQAFLPFREQYAKSPNDSWRLHFRDSDFAELGLEEAEFKIGLDLLEGAGLIDSVNGSFKLTVEGIRVCRHPERLELHLARMANGPPALTSQQFENEDSVRKTETRVFISHSSEDQALASKFVELVDSVLTVPQHGIRCTSVPGYKLEPGDDGPDKLRDNLRDAEVVVGLLSQNSLKSAYVLMELGAAWGLKSRIVPVLSEGVSFGSIPGPIGQGIHAVKISDAEGVTNLLDSLSRRCGMEWRGSRDRQRAQITSFVQFGATYLAQSGTAHLKENGEEAAATPPLSSSMSDGDKVGRLRLWLHDHTDDPRSQGKPFPMAEIDAEMGLPSGSAESHLDQALDNNWRVVRRSGSYIELLYAPRVREADGPWRSG